MILDKTCIRCTEGYWVTSQPSSVNIALRCPFCELSKIVEELKVKNEEMKARIKSLEEYLDE